MRTNEEKLELFADILEPAANILADPEIKSMVESKAPVISVVKYAIKTHKKEITEILARFEGVEPGNYKINGIALIMKLLNVMNDPDVKTMADELFSSPLQTYAAASVGNAMASIQAGV